MVIQNNDLTNNVIALKLKQSENIQNTIHCEDKFGKHHTLKYSILSLSIANYVSFTMHY